jgi:3-hydroxyisobutyrate dehydrogenase-like beta-hydroxyacid dehydrogenase
MNNILLLANMQLALDTFAVAERCGLDAEAVAAAFRFTSAQSHALAILAMDPMDRGDLPGQMAKEFGILSQQIEAAGGVQTLVVPTAEQLLRTMQRNPHEWAPAVYPTPVDVASE